MVKLIARIIFAIAISIAFASAGVVGNADVLQTLFTVLGIVFSISMSLLVSFSLSKVLNAETRTRLRYSIKHTRNWLLIDFSISAAMLLVALVWSDGSLRYTIGAITIDVLLLAVSFIVVSLAYEIYNFTNIHKLHSDIEDTVIAEEAAKNR
jgi:hypothetical protein